MDDLFDSSKPHFAAWLQVHDMDEAWHAFSPIERQGGSPLYRAAFCGFYDLVEHLIAKHPEQVNAISGRVVAPLPAALHRRHFQVADLLYQHGAAVDIRGIYERTPLHTASMFGLVDVMRWLLNHGADVNAKQDDCWTPLHLATYNTDLEAVQVLLGHNADVDLLNEIGRTPLYVALFGSLSPEGKAIDVVRQLLEHGADPNARDHNLSSPLHLASIRGQLEISRLLLSHGANVDEKDEEGRTPLQVASSKGHIEIIKLLSDHGAKPEPYCSMDASGLQLFICR